jgi:hypothetical protein
MPIFPSRRSDHRFAQCAYTRLPLVRLGTRNGVRKNRQFIDIQFAVMILVRKRELLFEKSKYLGL